MKYPLILAAAAAAMIWSAPAAAQSPCHTSTAAFSLALEAVSASQYRLSRTLSTASQEADMALRVLHITGKQMLEVALARIAAAMERDQAARQALTDATERVKTACGVR